MAELSSIVDEEKALLQLRLSNLEDTITHLQFINAQTAANHKQGVNSLQARIAGKLILCFFHQSSTLLLFIFFSPTVFSD